MPTLSQMVTSALLAITALLPNVAAAQANYPVKPIRLIIPFPAGGGPDVIMRRASNELQQRIGQGFVIDNRGGGNFVIGAEACARSAGDGYTVCHVNST